MQLNFKIIINILFLIVLSYFISFIMFLFLPSMPYYKYPYKKVITFFDIDLTNKLVLPVKKKKVIKKPFVNYLKDFKLQSIYFDGKKGFIIINDHSKSVFINLNETYKGYKLIKINLESVVFSRDNQKYTLYLNSKKKNSSKENVSHNVVRKTVPKHRLKKVQRSLIKYYLHNFGIIWQNIGIVKVSLGYKITYISPNSIFSRLGLRKGDILISINGRQLNNDSDAWNIVNNINKFDEIRVTILRNNTKKRLKYEID